MSSQGIKMTKVVCNLVEHQGKSIKTLCLNPECKESSTLCSKCLIKGHLQCRSQVYEFAEIPKQLMELQQLQQAMLNLQKKINESFKELLSRIDQFMQPVFKYQNLPNFTNLNEVGFLLRKMPQQSILKSIDETKIQIQLLLDNQNSLLDQNNQNQNSDNQNQKGIELFMLKRYDEAIVCFEKALGIDPNHPAAKSNLILALIKLRGKYQL